VGTSTRVAVQNKLADDPAGKGKNKLAIDWNYEGWGM
jgi:hypothetical protein